MCRESYMQDGGGLIKINKLLHWVRFNIKYEDWFFTSDRNLTWGLKSKLRLINLAPHQCPEGLRILVWYHRYFGPDHQYSQGLSSKPLSMEIVVFKSLPFNTSTTYYVSAYIHCRIQTDSSRWWLLSYIAILFFSTSIWAVKVSLSLL